MSLPTEEPQPFTTTWSSNLTHSTWSGRSTTGHYYAVTEIPMGTYKAQVRSAVTAFYANQQKPVTVTFDRNSEFSEQLVGAAV